MIKPRNLARKILVFLHQSNQPTPFSKISENFPTYSLTSIYYNLTKLYDIGLVNYLTPVKQKLYYIPHVTDRRQRILVTSKTIGALLSSDTLTKLDVLLLEYLWASGLHKVYIKLNTPQVVDS